MPPPGKSRPRRWAPWLIILLLPLAVHLPFVLSGRSANPIYYTARLSAGLDSLLPGAPGFNDPNTGTTKQALGGIAAGEWLHGTVPWWNPYSGLGLPLAAEMQSSALFLPFVLLLRAFNGVLYLKISMQIVTGLAGYALLRQLGLRRRVALTGAILMEFCGTFSWMGHGMEPLPFLPLLLLGIERALAHAENRRPGGWAWIPVAVAWSLYAGFPEMAFINGLLAAAWTICRFAHSPERWRFATKITIGGVLGLLIAAPLIVPFFQLLALGYAGVNDFPVGLIPLPAPDFALQLVPYLYGPVDFDFQWPTWTETGGYLGLPLLLLAILAVLRGEHQRGLRWLLAGWIVVATAKSLQLPVLAQAIDLIPFMSQTFFYHYSAPSWEIAAIILAAFVLNGWINGMQSRGPIARHAMPLAITACVLLLAVSLVAGLPFITILLKDQPTYPLYLSASLAATCAVSAAIAALLSAAYSPRRGAALLCLLGINAVALYTFPLLSATRPMPLDRNAVAFLQQHLGLQRFFTLAPFAPNYAGWFGLASINHDTLPVPRIWVDYIHTHLDPSADAVTFNGNFPPSPPGTDTHLDALRHNLPAYAALGVRFVLTPPDVALQNTASATAPRRVYQDPLMNIYEIPNAAPYFETPGTACALAPENRQTIAVDCPATATLLRRELAYPGWRAQVNGAPAAVTPIGEIFQSVRLPPGRSEIRFTYAPAGAGWLAVLFGLGLAGWLAGLAHARAKTKY